MSDVYLHSSGGKFVKRTNCTTCPKGRCSSCEHIHASATHSVSLHSTPSYVAGYICSKMSFWKKKLNISNIKTNLVSLQEMDIKRPVVRIFFPFGKPKFLFHARNQLANKENLSLKGNFFTWGGLSCGMWTFPLIFGLKALIFSENLPEKWKFKKYSVNFSGVGGDIVGFNNGSLSFVIGMHLVFSSGK